MAEGTQLGKAYVQIIPSAKGISGAIKSALGNAPDQAGAATGQSMGSSLVGKFKAVIAAAGLGVAFSKALTEGAALEQSIGGVETLFKDSADTIKQYAAEAYKTAGVSANSYMEQVTSFSASLLQSLDGDTAEAAEYANRALVDMSDNANKMGTDIESIQYAYQGFAKANYTMLDNLKLGYGGTKEEMARLIKEASEMTGIQEELGVTVDASSMSFGNVVNAISVMQKSLGIAGTTADEAATTLSGSLASMKAAFSNVLGNLTLGQDITPALNGLADTVTTFLVGNLLPAVWNILKALPSGLVTFVQSLIPQLAAALMQFVPQMQASITTGAPQLLVSAQQIVMQLCSGFETMWPQLIEQGGELLTNIINGITSYLPQVFQMALNIITSFVNTFIQNYPKYIQTGTELLMSLINGIREALPQMLVAAGEAIASMVSGLIQNLPQIIRSGFELVISLIQGIGNALPDIITAAGEVCSMLWDEIKNVDWLQLGKDIILGLIDGIGAMAGALWEAATNIARSALDAIKSFFGIASPSRVMRDEVGRWIPLGIAEGITDNMGSLKYAMSDVRDMVTGQMAGVQARLSTALCIDPAMAVPAVSESSRGNQYIYFEQPMQAPDEIARALRIQQQYGLAGAR